VPLAPQAAVVLPHLQPECRAHRIVKGYEFEKDQYVLFTEEEMDKVEPSSARTLEILELSSW